MLQIITIDTYFKTLSQLPIIDVRSPGEYAKGHIPEAINISLFSNEERTDIGTLYKQVSKEKAIEQGYKYVNPKLDFFLSRSLVVAPDKKVVVHCWRGGMRSNSFANYLLEKGFKEVYLIEKGYKAYRNYVLDFFTQNFNLKILGGFTGSGKTEILACLSKEGCQVIDLEGIANHRGSAFGGIDLPLQPTTEQFENDLCKAISSLNVSEAIWLEDESNGIGRVNIPKTFFKQMREQTVYFLNISRKERVKHLVDTYGSLNKIALANSIEKIAKRLGNDRAVVALEALKNNNFAITADIILHYYDKYYLRGLHRREADKVVELKVDSTKHINNANILLNLNTL